MSAGWRVVTGVWGLSVLVSSTGAAQDGGRTKPPPRWLPNLDIRLLTVETPPPSDPGFGGEVWVGDLDGDGFDDLVSPAQTWGEINEGRVFAFRGPKLDLWAALRADHEMAEGRFGTCTLVHDFDLDGRCEVVAAATMRPNSNHAALFVFRAEDWSTPEVIELPYPGGFGTLGQPLDTGDVDGDGYPDLVVAYPSAQRSDGRGAVCVLYGPDLRRVDTIPAPESDDLRLWATSVEVADFDGDGHDDVVITDPHATGIEGIPVQGRFWVYFGPDFQRVRERDNPDDTQAVWFGQHCTSGDLNGDGFDDLVLASPRAAVDPDDEFGVGAGVVWVFWGPGLRDGRRKALRLTNLPIDELGGQFGQSVVARDVDQDGWLDLAIGAPGTVRSEPDGTVIGGEVNILHGPDFIRWERILHPKVEGASNLLGFRTALGDITGDGEDEIVSGFAGFDHVHVIDRSGFEPFVRYRSSTRRPPALHLDGRGLVRPGQVIEVVVDGLRSGEVPWLFASWEADSRRLGSGPPGPESRLLLLAEPLLPLGELVPVGDRGDISDPTLGRLFRVPPFGELIGTRLRLQAFVPDANDPLGFRESNGLTLTVQGL